MRDTITLFAGSGPLRSMPGDHRGQHTVVNVTDTAPDRARGLNPDVIIILDDISEELEDTLIPMYQYADAVVDLRE